MSTVVKQQQQQQQQQQQPQRLWKRCSVCVGGMSFKTPVEFSRHLRDAHCTREGGSFVCKYGYNGVCSSLPLEGVSDRDYEDHVARHHVFLPADINASTSAGNKTQSSKGNSVLPVSPFRGDQPNVVAVSTGGSGGNGTGGGGVSCAGAESRETEEEWTFYSSAQNLPAVLNDPGRTKQRDFFSKTWGDSFVERVDIPPCPYLREITRAHFEDYVLKISKRHKKNSRRSSAGSRISAEGDQNSSQRRLQAARSADWNQSDIDSIPKIFLQPNFSLDNPETFNIVFPNVQLGPQSPTTTTPSGTNNQKSGRLLQEKLSHYLDTVEVQIARHISLRSEAFFHAMTSHDVLMERLTTTVQQVKKLRERVHHIDDILVKDSLHILRLKHRRETFLQVFKKLKFMATVHQTQPTIQLLLTNSDFVGALDLISTTQEVLEQELADIHSFRHLGSQLAELEKVIDKMMHSDFLRYLSTDLSRPLSDTEMVMEEDRLVAIVLGMLRLKKHTFISVYREEAFVTVKAVIKESVVDVVEKFKSTATPENNLSLVEQMRMLEFDGWIALVHESFDRLEKLLSRVKAVQSIMCDAVDIAAGKARSRSSPSSYASPEASSLNFAVDSEEVTVSAGDHTRLTLGLKDMLVSISDYSDDRSAKMFSGKSKDGFFERLSMQEFVVLSKCVDEFVFKCETMCGKKSTNLQLALQSQAHRFVNRFHDERKSKLGLILDSERWKQTDVPANFQDLVDHICIADSLNIPKTSSESDLNDDRKPQEVLLVKGERYAVIGTVLLLLNMAMEYCACVTGIPQVASDLLTRIVELLKTFNSRSCQLVLGAGALQLVGLKTITTKNLALASRCLQLMAFFIPKIKIHFDKHLSAKQQHVSKQFDQVLKDYNDHVQEITNKLISIMENMFEVQLNKWEVKPPVPSPCFRGICKQLGKFHEAVADVLPIDQVQKLFLHINTAFKAGLRKQLRKMSVQNDGGPQHGLVTSELAFYLQSLKSISCIRDEESLGMDDIWVVR